MWDGPPEPSFVKTARESRPTVRCHSSRSSSAIKPKAWGHWWYCIKGDSGAELPGMATRRTDHRRAEFTAGGSNLPDSPRGWHRPIEFAGRNRRWTRLVTVTPFNPRTCAAAHCGHVDPSMVESVPGMKGEQTRASGRNALPGWQPNLRRPDESENMPAIFGWLYTYRR